MTEKTVAENNETAQEYRISLVYPFNWNGVENFDYDLDDRGIPFVDMGKKFGFGYNPITIAQYGLFSLQRYTQSKSEACLQKVQNISCWLADNFCDWRGDMGAWIYDFDLDFYGPKAPWISGMAQGQGISFLLRMFQIQPENRFLEISQRAYRAFLYPVSEGGVVSYFPDGSIIFEEYPTNPPSQVLNGHIFALLGIFDYWEYWKEQSAKELFQTAINGLKKNLQRYDTGYWNLYDLHPTRRLASPMYMKVHVQLLDILAEVTGDLFFEKTAKKWKNHLANPICRFRWLMGKSIEKIRLQL